MPPLEIPQTRQDEIAKFALELTDDELEYLVIGLGMTRMGLVGAFDKSVLQKLIRIQITDGEWESFLKYLSYSDIFTEVFLEMIKDYWASYIKSKAKVN